MLYILLYIISYFVEMNIHLPCAHGTHQAFDPLLDPENMEGFSHVNHSGISFMTPWANPSSHHLIWLKNARLKGNHLKKNTTL